MNDPCAAELGLRRERGAEAPRDALVLPDRGEGWLRGGHHAEDPFAPHGLRLCPAAGIGAAAGAGRPGAPTGLEAPDYDSEAAGWALFALADAVRPGWLAEDCERCGDPAAATGHGPCARAVVTAFGDAAPGFAAVEAAFGRAIMDLETVP